MPFPIPSAFSRSGLRLVAGILALMWVLSGSLCALHCQRAAGAPVREDGKPPSGHGCCHQERASGHPDRCHEGSSGPACLILALVPDSASGPVDGVAWLPLTDLPGNPDSDRPAASFPRGAGRAVPVGAADRPTLPAEFLGPAFRTLAPPAVS